MKWLKELLGMPMEPKKVYCDNCDNFRNNKCIIAYKDTPIESVPIYGNYEELNKYNNCNRHHYTDPC